MLSSIKKLDKKFLIIAGIVLGLPIFILVFLAIMQGCTNKVITHDKYEIKMVEAMERYMKDSKKAPVEEGEVVNVKLSTLVKKGYIDSTEDLLEDTTCKGSVSVRRNGASVETTNGGYLNYTVELECDDYSTKTLVDEIKENVVTAEDGLYADGENFVFKGNKVKNYINFFGHSYRIVSVDKDGILKLVRSEPEMTNRIWDNKYNISTNRNSGKNIYKDSKILLYLLEDYKNTKKISSKAKQYVMAYDVCIGKRSSTDYTIDTSLDCSEKLEKQIISLLNVSDYAKASLDPDCKDLKSFSCNNYNYLYNIVPSTWTMNVSLDNTYEVIYLSNGIMYTQNANSNNEYNIVIYIDGNQTYTSGTGSVNDPYVYE